METVTLLKELFGEEPIKKVVNSGFDSVKKIAAASPESLAFFAGINEALAKQIIASAEESAKAPDPKGYRAALSGAAAAPVAPRAAAPSPASSTSKPRSNSTSDAEGGEAQDGAEEPAEPSPNKFSSVSLDANPRLDAGQILKTVASERCADEVDAETSLLEGLGLSDAETLFLDGGSPWSAPTKGNPMPKGKVANPEEGVPERETSSLECQAGEQAGRQVEWAPVSNWSPEKDPDPIPRVVRAPELGPDPNSALEPAVSHTTHQESTSGALSLKPKKGGAGQDSREAVLESKPETPGPKSISRPSFWRFGK